MHMLTITTSAQQVLGGILDNGLVDPTTRLDAMQLIHRLNALVQAPDAVGAEIHIAHEVQKPLAAALQKYLDAQCSYVGDLLQSGNREEAIDACRDLVTAYDLQTALG